jgi:hypothetical protein
MCLVQRSRRSYSLYELLYEYVSFPLSSLLKLMTGKPQRSKANMSLSYLKLKKWDTKSSSVTKIPMYDCLVVMLCTWPMIYKNNSPWLQLWPKSWIADHVSVSTIVTWNISRVGPRFYSIYPKSQCSHKLKSCTWSKQLFLCATKCLIVCKTQQLWYTQHQ